MGCFCWEVVGTMAPVEGNIYSFKYQKILEENLWPVLARHLPWNGYFSQDDNAPVHRSRPTQEHMVRKLSKLACSVPRSKCNRNYVAVHQKKTPILLLGCKIEGRFDRGNSADLDRNQACLHSDLVWLDTKFFQFKKFINNISALSIITRHVVNVNNAVIVTEYFLHVSVFLAPRPPPPRFQTP